MSFEFEQPPKLTKREELRMAHEAYTKRPLPPLAMFFMYGLLSAQQIEQKIAEFKELEKLKTDSSALAS